MDTDDTITGPLVTTVEDEYVERRKRQEKQLAGLRDTNTKKYRSLLGQKLLLNPQGVLTTRIEALLDLLFDADGRLAFDLIFEEKMTGLLNEALADARQADILKGVNPPSKLILPG
jgi:hypothetical protein